jgi:hypothetical protein
VNTPAVLPHVKQGVSPLLEVDIGVFGDNGSKHVEKTRDNIENE